MIRIFILLDHSMGPSFRKDVSLGLKKSRLLSRRTPPHNPLLAPLLYLIRVGDSKSSFTSSVS